MEKTFLLLSIFFLLPFIWSCGNKNEQAGNTAFRPDLDDCKLSIDLKLSDLVEDYRLVRLETTNESLLGEFSSVINISGNYIIIRDRNNVYKFSKEGRFINIILKNGKGPGEISGSCRFFFDKNTDILFFEDDFFENERIRCYDVKSEKFLPSIKKCFQGRWLNFIVYQDSLILGSIEGINKGETNPNAAFVQNFKGEFIWGIKSNKTFIVPGHDSNEDVLQRFIIYSGDRSIYLKYRNDDTLFTLNDKNLSAYLIPEYKNKIQKPGLMIFEGDRIINYDPCQNTAFVIIRHGLFTGWTNEGNFNRAHYNMDYYILNKLSGKYALIQSYIDDLTGKKINLGKAIQWTPGVDEMPPLPQTSTDGLIYSIYYPHELPGNDSELKNSPFKTLLSQLNEIRKSLKETDNPVLLIGYPKKRLRILN